MRRSRPTLQRCCRASAEAIDDGDRARLADQARRVTAALDRAAALLTRVTLMATQTKITYATMTARSDGGSPSRAGYRHRTGANRRSARATRSMIGGRDVKASSEFDDRSPIDTRILLGKFQSASREQVRDAIAAAKAAVPGVERAAVARARRAAEEGRRPDSRSSLGAVGADGLRGRQEPPRVRRRRRGVGRSHRVLLHPDGEARRLRDHARHARARARRTPACCGRTACGR